MQIINSGTFLVTYFWKKISGKRHLLLNDAKVLLRDSIYNTPPSQRYQTASENVSFEGMPLDTNRFRWKSSFSIRERLRKIPIMLDDGVESRSHGVQLIY